MHRYGADSCGVEEALSWKMTPNLGFPNWNPKQQWSLTHNWGMGWHRLELYAEQGAVLNCDDMFKFFDPLGRAACYYPIFGESCIRS